MTLESSVVENITSDFNWLPDFMVWLGGLAPLFAIIWAIGAYYRGRRDDRSDQLRSERRDLYRRYLMVLDEKDDELEGDFSSSPGIQKTSELLPLQTELSLIAPNEVWSIALKLFPILIFQKRIPSFVSGSLNPEYARQVVEESEEYRECRRLLVHAMRKDLLHGSDLDPQLSNVEDV